MLMIERKIPHKQLILETIVRRMHTTDQDYRYYQELLGRIRAEFSGEQRVDREWKEIDIPCRYYLFHDLELNNDVGSTHQMDTLFICPYFVFVIEVKNIVGRIDFSKENHQFTRTTSDGRVDGFKNPFDQVQRHTRFLRKIFHEKGIQIPIVHAVISANPNMIMTHSLVTQPIFHVSGLVHKLEQLFYQYQEVLLDEKQLKQLARKLAKMHTPRRWQLDIEWAKLRKGVLCPNCAYQTVMHYEYGQWFCGKCKGSDNKALFVAMHDYRIMEGDLISNRQFRDFFGIISAKTVYNTLKLLDFEKTGGNKNRRYVIPEDVLTR